MRKFNLGYALESMDNSEVGYEETLDDVLFAGLEQSISSCESFLDLHFKRSGVNAALESIGTGISTEGVGTYLKDLIARIIEWFKKLFSTSSESVNDEVLDKAEEKIESKGEGDILLLPAPAGDKSFEEKLLESPLMERINCLAYSGIFGISPELRPSIAEYKKFETVLTTQFKKFGSAVDAVASSGGNYDHINQQLAEAQDAIAKASHDVNPKLGDKTLEMLEAEGYEGKTPAQIVTAVKRISFQPLGDNGAAAAKVAKLYTKKSSAKSQTKYLRDLNKVMARIEAASKRYFIPACEKASKLEVASPSFGQAITTMSNATMTLVKISKSATKIHGQLAEMA